jgi:CDP-diacylglycerol--glycerol-3-phosphate 3-phosphatidyltransferase
MRGLRLLAAVCVLLPASVFLCQLTRNGWGASAWIRLLTSGAACAWLPVFLWRRRGLAAEAGSALWGAANLLTLLRGLLIAVLAGYVFAPRSAGLSGWLPALVYTAVICLDFLDGTVARRTGTRTLLGGALDQELDGLGLLVAMGLVVQYGVLPWQLLLVGLAHYLFALALFTRRRSGHPVHPLPPDPWRRRLAGFQMALAAAFLWPIARRSPALLAEALIGAPFLLGFLRDWLVVSGRLDSGGPLLTRWRARAVPWLNVRLPLLLRAACLLLALAAIYANLGGAAESMWQALLPPAGGPAGAHAAAWLTTLALLGLAGGRGLPFFALTVIVLAGLPSYLADMTLPGAAQLACALLLLLLGGGPRLSRLRMRPQ